MYTLFSDNVFIFYEGGEGPTKTVEPWNSSIYLMSNFTQFYTILMYFQRGKYHMLHVQ